MERGGDDDERVTAIRVPTGPEWFSGLAEQVVNSSCCTLAPAVRLRSSAISQAIQSCPDWHPGRPRRLVHRVYGVAE